MRPNTPAQLYIIALYKICQQCLLKENRRYGMVIMYMSSKSAYVILPTSKRLQL